MSVRIDRVRFAAALARADLTVKALSERTGISRGTITSVKNGKSCSQQTADKLAAVLVLASGENSQFGSGDFNQFSVG